MFQPFAFYGSGESTTPDADAWIAQVISDGGSLSNGEKDAVRDLETDLKATSGLYDDLIAIYPLVGGDEASCKYNLKNAATSFDFTIGYSGSWTFDSNGVTGDGTSTYGNTNLSPATVATGSYGSNTGIGLHVYLTVNVSSPSSYDLGANEQSVIAGFNDTYLYANFKSSPGDYVKLINQVAGTGDLYSAQHDTTGIGVTSNWKNGASVNSSPNKTWTTSETNTFYLGNDHRGGSNPEYGNKGYGFAAISSYLDSTKMSGLYTAVLAYNQALSR